MGRRLEEVAGMRIAPPSIGAEEIAGSWNATAARRGLDGGTGALARGEQQDTAGGGSATKAHGKPGKLPGFEFENWAVLQLGEVLWHRGHRIFAETIRSKVDDPLYIIPVRVQSLIEESSDVELMALRGKCLKLPQAHASLQRTAARLVATWRWKLAYHTRAPVCFPTTEFPVLPALFPPKCIAERYNSSASRARGSLLNTTSWRFPRAPSWRNLCRS
jgi:hypothetical protein